MNEPLMRIGIILKEDKKREISFILPKENEFGMFHLMCHYEEQSNEVISKNQIVSHSLAMTCETSHEFELWEENKKIITLQNGTEYKIFSGDNLKLESPEGSLNLGSKIIIKPLKEYPKIYQSVGIKINNIVTGRKFHWQKEITQYLMGALEIQNHKDYLTVVNEILLEEYLMSVATSEMSGKCPSVLLEAQTIAARSWIMARTEKKHAKDGFDACNDDCCQRYHGTGQLNEHSVQAVLNTKGLVLVYNDKICDARYSKSCGGFMEKYENVWTGEPLPYLTSGFDGEPTDSIYSLSKENAFKDWINRIPLAFCSPEFIKEEELKQYLGYVDEQGQYFRWQIIYQREELEEILKNKSIINDLKTLLDIKTGERGDSGRLKDITIEYMANNGELKFIKIESEYKIRESLHKSFLYSSAFILEIYKDEKNILRHFDIVRRCSPTGLSASQAQQLPLKFILKGAGWGHGAGLCQIGALGMALKGYSTGQILEHYYKGSILGRGQDSPLFSLFGNQTYRSS